MAKITITRKMSDGTVVSVEASSAIEAGQVFNKLMEILARIEAKKG